MKKLLLLTLGLLILTGCDLFKSDVKRETNLIKKYTEYELTKEMRTVYVPNGKKPIPKITYHYYAKVDNEFKLSVNYKVYKNGAKKKSYLQI